MPTILQVRGWRVFDHFDLIVDEWNEHFGTTNDAGN